MLVAPFYTITYRKFILLLIVLEQDWIEMIRNVLIHCIVIHWYDLCIIKEFVQPVKGHFVLVCDPVLSRNNKNRIILPWYKRRNVYK